jgi:hypothetical protein
MTGGWKTAALLVAALSACTAPEEAAVVTGPGGLNLRATWQANLSGAANGSGQLADYGAYFDAELTFSGGAAGTAYQWRIFNGTCAAPGLQFGPNQAYPNVTTNGSGTAQVERTVSGPLNLTAPYNVRVSTVAAPVTIVACGDLQH